MLSNILFNSKINGITYKIYEYTVGLDEYVTMKSDLKNNVPSVYSIQYDSNTSTFNVTDYITIKGRKVKLLFNLDLELNIVGFIYNDLENSYEQIPEYKSKHLLTTEDVYSRYLTDLYLRLDKYLTFKEENFNQFNQKMLRLRNINSKE